MPCSSPRAFGMRSAGFNPSERALGAAQRGAMVEFVLIRLAEIRAEAAQEEYDLAHPREAALRKRLRWLRIKAKLFALWAAATPPAVWCRRRAALLHAWLRAQYNVLALAFTRRLGVPPPRAVVYRWRSSCPSKVFCWSCPSKVFCWSSSCAEPPVEEALARCPLEELSAAT